MPIALLLTELQKRRRQWVPVFADWCRLLATEELLWQRARGAFLRKWYGPGLQFSGPALIVGILNMEALHNQLLFARQNADDGMNLMEPIAGMLGGFIGSFIGFIIYISPWLLLGLGVIGGILAVWYKLSHPSQPDSGSALGPMSEAAYRFSASLAHMIEQFLKFWGWLTGPREKIVNPIIRAAMNILDRVPQVTIHLVAFIAIFLTRIVPFLARLIHILPAFYNLIVSVVSYLRTVVQDLSDKLHDLTAGRGSPLSILHRVIDMLEGVADRLQHLVKPFHAMITALSTMWTNVKGILSDWLSETRLELEYRVRQTAIVRFFLDVGDMYTAIKDVLAAHFPRIASFLGSPPGTVGKWLRRKYHDIADSGPGVLPDTAKVHALTQLLEGDTPVAGQWEEWWSLREKGLMPDVDAYFDRQTLIVPPMSAEFPKGPFSMTSDLYRQLTHDLNRPLPDAFAGEQRALRTRAGGEPHEQLLRIHDGALQYYRDVIGSVLDRMIGPAGAGFFASLESKLDRLDQELNEFDPALHLRPSRPAVAPLPVLDLREENRLRLEVPSFRIRYHGKREHESLIRSFGDELRAAWVGQEYLLPAGS